MSNDRSQPATHGGPPGNWIRTFRRLPEVDSTNRYALHELDRTAETPALVVADRQTAGRGRLGRSWYADAGTLTFSLVLADAELRHPRDQWPRLALVAGLAVAEAIEVEAAPVRASLKWPNDVYIDRGKVAGILVETGSPGGGPVVIGVGVNVATDWRAAPAEVAARARSLASVLGRPVDRDSLFGAIIDRLAEGVQGWSADPLGFLDAYRPRCYLSGRNVRVRQGTRVVEGQCRGLAEDGSLMVDAADGTAHRLHSGEIEWFSPASG